MGFPGCSRGQGSTVRGSMLWTVTPWVGPLVTVPLTCLMLLVPVLLTRALAAAMPQAHQVPAEWLRWRPHLCYFQHQEVSGWARWQEHPKCMVSARNCMVWRAQTQKTEVNEEQGELQVCLGTPGMRQSVEGLRARGNQTPGEERGQ